jgi:hypothetical protein
MTILETITNNMETGIGMMRRAIDSHNQRLWDGGQGAYDGAVKAASLECLDISSYTKQGEDLIKQAQGVGLIIRGRQ